MRYTDKKYIYRLLFTPLKAAFLDSLSQTPKIELVSNEMTMLFINVKRRYGVKMQSH